MELVEKDIPVPESSSIPGPAPDQRHAQPSGPWPWMDVEFMEDDADHLDVPVPLPANAPKLEWREYPQSLFRNWTPAQVRRSGIRDAIDKHQEYPCKIYVVDVMGTGKFETREARTILNTEKSKTDFWDMLNGTGQRPAGVRVRSLCVENMSGPVLQMLGSKYTIEPFFFSSSLNWIPSRYREIVSSTEGLGDHITITLTFLRGIRDPLTVPSNGSSKTSFDSVKELPSLRGDPQASLILSSSKMVLRQDLLALHMIRSPEGSTIITYHPDPEWRTTSAKILNSRIKLAGDSVYWQNIFRKTADPTFILLTILWHCLYTWDHALEILYAHISWLEAKIIRTNDISMSTELHIIRAHLLHYDGLLVDFEKSVLFIQDTPNPAIMGSEKEIALPLLKKECGNLLSEIARLERSRQMQHERLKNVMNLAFTTVNIIDSKQMQKLTEAARDDNAAMKTLTEAAVGDSAAMKQIAYLSMFFLPSTFVTGFFGMNVYEINPGTLGSFSHYFAVAIPLTLVTVWVIVALQSKRFYGQNDATIFPHLLWPYIVGKRLWRGWRSRRRAAKKKDDDLHV